MRISPQAVLWMIDDNHSDLELGSIVCEAMHFPGRFVAFSDGVSALTRLGEVWGGPDQPDALLLDVNMPQMGGLAVLRAIRRDPRWQDLPVVMFSSSTNEIQIAQRDGATDYLLKADVLTGTLRAFRSVVERFCRRLPDDPGEGSDALLTRPPAATADG